MLLQCLRGCRNIPKYSRSLFSTPIAGKRNYPISPIQPASPRNAREEVEIGQLMRSIEHFMRLTLQRKNFEAFIHKQIKHGAKSITPSRIVAVFETIIGLLVDNNRFHEAVSVYLRMKNENLAPSAPTDADMLVITYALSDTHIDPNIKKSLALNVASPTFTEANLKRILELMFRLHLPGSLVTEVIGNFLRSRETPPSSQLIAKLIDFQIEAGYYHGAMDILREFQPEDSDHAGSKVYGAALEALAHQGPESSENIDIILKTMAERDITADFRVFNAIIRRNVRTEAWATAFATYNMMLETTKLTGVSPDSRTFILLFHAHEAMLASPKKAATSDNIRPARLLFRDVLSTCFNAKNPRAQEDIVAKNLSILHMAVRTFLSLGDYSAAYVALSSFEKLGVPVTYILYRFVVRKLADIILFAPPTPKKPRALDLSFMTWTFFGVPHLDQEAVTLLTDSASVCRRLLTSAAKSELHMKPAPDLQTAMMPEWTTNPDTREIYVPIWSVVCGRKAVPASMEAELKALPLLRLMKRAILASFGHPPHKILDPNEQRTWGTRQVSQAIAEAKEVMVPHGQQYFKPAKDNRSWYSQNHLRAGRVAHRKP